MSLAPKTESASEEKSLDRQNSHQYQKLIRKKIDELGKEEDRLTSSLDELKTQPQASDLMDIAEASRSRDQLLKRRQDVRDKIQALREALDRTNAGTYGICGKCGDEISEPRLLAVPTATRCIECANGVH